MNANASRLLTEKSFLTAGGTETFLFFRQRFAMREFCAFEVFDHEGEIAKLEQEYLYPLMTAVARHGHGLLLDAMVWRAHPDYVAALGYPAADIKRINERAVARTRASVADWRRQHAAASADFPVLIAADIGPRGDGYQVGNAAPSVASAEAYHRVQLDALAAAGVDAVCALTMTTANEAIGIGRAAEKLRVPIIVSPTVETDGRLPDGSTLADFIDRVDGETAGAPLYYMVNCAHPTHLKPTLDAAAESGKAWLARFKGFRANSSRKSHAELDNSTELDRGNPAQLAAEMAALKRSYDLKLVGGCCGTDAEHIAAIAAAA